MFVPLLEAWDDGSPTVDEMFVSYDLNRSKNEYSYWKFQRFDRFKKNDIYRLKEALRIPDTVRTYNRIKFDGEEALSTKICVPYENSQKSRPGSKIKNRNNFPLLDEVGNLPSYMVSMPRGKVHKIDL